MSTDVSFQKHCGTTERLRGALVDLPGEDAVDGRRDPKHPRFSPLLAVTPKRNEATELCFHVSNSASKTLRLAGLRGVPVGVVAFAAFSPPRCDRLGFLGGAQLHVSNGGHEHVH